MSINLVNLVGMTSAIASTIQSKAKITTLEEFRNATDTPEERAKLAEITGQAIFAIYNWAKQADLLQCKEITPEIADKLIRAGIRCVSDLSSADTEKLADFIFNQNIDSDVDEYKVLDWISSAQGISSNLEPDSSDLKNPSIFPSTALKSHSITGLNTSLASSNAYGSDISDIITELGVGVAQAQKQMDLASIEIQNQILRDPVLSNYGMNATWYAIPEVSFTLKMEYTYSEEGTSHIQIVPMNATYNNLFKSSRAEESTLNLKIVPVPAPEEYTKRTYMPNLIGLSLEEAAEELEKIGYTATYKIVAGYPSNGKDSEVIYQSVAEGSILLINKAIILKVYDIEEQRKAVLSTLANCLKAVALNCEHKGFKTVKEWTNTLKGNKSATQGKKK